MVNPKLSGYAMVGSPTVDDNVSPFIILKKLIFPEVMDITNKAPKTSKK